MENSLIGRLLFSNWQRKAVALISAIILWFFLNSSITDTKTIPNIPIRITNLPADKTIMGLLPNRLLSKRVTLTLSGRKDVIQELGPGDLEVLLDVSTADSDEWVVKITKKNLVSLNPSINLLQHITQVEYSDFVLKLSPLVTAKIPIKVLPPIGAPPEGYEYLDIWPQKLLQTVSGPEEEIEPLRTEGLELELNIGEITKADLDAIKPLQNGKPDGEVSFFVPDRLKKVTLPFRNHSTEEINDPEAASLHIDFLRKDTLKINAQIPVRIFYPLKYSEQINAKTFPLKIDSNIKEKNGIFFLSFPLYTKDVSNLFLEIIQEYIEINIVAAPKSEKEVLGWSLEVIDPHELEDLYIAYMQKNLGEESSNKRREALLRKRFKEYMQRLALYIEPDRKLDFEAMLVPNGIQVNILK